MRRTPTSPVSSLLLMLLLLLAAHSANAGGLSLVQEASPKTDAVAVSADGFNVYAPDYPNNLRVFTRNAMSGEITLVQSVEQGVGGVDGIYRSDGVAVTPDGVCVYATSQRDHNMAAFVRLDGTGELVWVQVKKDGDHGGDVTGFLFPSPVVVSPDSRHVYVGAEFDANISSNWSSVAVFERVLPGCSLTPVETEIGGSEPLGRAVAPAIAMAPDGKNLYVAGRILQGEKLVGGLNVLTRNTTTGHLSVLQRIADGVGTVERLGSPVRSVAVSPDGANVYAASGGDSSIVVFSRDGASGALTFVEAQRDGGFIDGMEAPRAVRVSPDGAYVYVTSFEDKAVVTFRRDAATGRLRFLESRKDPFEGDNYVLNPESNALQAFGDFLYVGTTVLAVDTCGNGNRGVDEQCDDGNVADGDGCSATCRLELCAPTPAAGCRGATPIGASLQIRDDARDTKDVLQWKFHGDATTLADFGDPLTSASYVVCVYDSSGNAQPLLASSAPSGGLCKKDAPCWKAKPTSYRYQDKLLTPDGIEILDLKEGLTDGDTGLKVKAKGINLVPPGLPLTLPVTVQVRNTGTAACWEAVYGTAGTNDGTRFKAKSD